MNVHIRRQWNDYNIATVKLEDIEDLGWSEFSGGVFRKSPRPFIHGYVYCDVIEGEIALHVYMVNAHTASKFV